MMTEDTARIIRLEMNLQNLQDREQANEAEIKALRKQVADTDKKINKAEVWGRSLLYFSLAVSGVLTQVQNIATWFKKL